MSTRLPGPSSQRLAERLWRYESRGSHVRGSTPIFWDRADDARIIDVDGNEYLDFCAAFSVAALGHSNPLVATSLAVQATRLMHAMGDLHPPAIRVQLLEKLAGIAPGDLSKSYICSTGTEAVEAALKTALLYNGRPRIIAFSGAYHGLSLGALEVCGLSFFRTPFASALSNRAAFVDYPRAGEGPAALDRTVAAIRDEIASGAVGALIVEPIQGRGGMIVPPDGFLSALRELCDQHRIALIFDEVYTGFARTGTLFAADHEGVVPDLLCVGKALGNGFPISATIGKAHIMDAWPESASEALHTSTFLGNPMGCAAALTTLAEIERRQLTKRAQELGEHVGRRLEALRASAPVVDVRGRGLFWGVEMRSSRLAETIIEGALQRGLMTFSDGPVISIMPPLTITREELDRGLEILSSLVQSQAA
ncbi:MAG: aspartate aminotransferase family protein [Candidatus Eremiobacteraeota bacterium]|nr:aspartate aminotransferase family protein [Candidatus Eremiobacteraeota bacterium]